MSVTEAPVSLADEVADSLVALAEFVREHPEFARPVAGEQFYKLVPTAEFDALAATLNGNDDTTDRSPYLLATREFGAITLAVQAPKDGASCR